MLCIFAIPSDRKINFGHSGPIRATTYVRYRSINRTLIGGRKRTFPPFLIIDYGGRENLYEFPHPACETFLLWAEEDLNLYEFPHMLLRHARIPFRHPPVFAKVLSPLTSPGFALTMIRAKSGKAHSVFIIFKERNLVTHPRLERGTPALKGQCSAR